MTRILLVLLTLIVTSQPSLAFGETQPKIRLGYFPNITHAQALYGKNTGEFAKETGSEIVWISFNAGPSAVEALFSDEIDGAYMGPNPAINGFIKSRGEKFVIVSGAATGGAGLVVRSGSNISSPLDFDGKTIATPQLGNTQDVAARAWLSNNGLKLKDKGGTVTIVPISNADQLSMMKRGEIDGAWTVEPWISRLEVETGAKLFLNEESLWPDGKFITTVLVLSKSFFAKNRETAQKLVAAHSKVTDLINEDKGKASVIINEQLKQETGASLGVEILSRAFDRVHFGTEPLPNALKKTSDDAFKLGFLRDAPDLTNIYDLTLLREVKGNHN